MKRGFMHMTVGYARKMLASEPQYAKFFSRDGQPVDAITALEWLAQFPADGLLDCSNGDACDREHISEKIPA